MSRQTSSIQQITYQVFSLNSENIRTFLSYSSIEPGKKGLTLSKREQVSLDYLVWIMTILAFPVPPWDCPIIEEISKTVTNLHFFCYFSPLQSKWSSRNGNCHPHSITLAIRATFLLFENGFSSAAAAMAHTHFYFTYKAQMSQVLNLSNKPFQLTLISTRSENIRLCCVYKDSVQETQSFQKKLRFFFALWRNF